MSNDDPINPQVPDIFRPELAVEERPQVKRWKRNAAMALLALFLVLGAAGVIGWQWMQARTELAESEEKNDAKFKKLEAKANVAVARFTDINATMTKLEQRTRALNAEINMVPAYTGKVSDNQRAALSIGENPRKWLVEKELELDALCKVLDPTLSSCPAPAADNAEDKGGRP